MPDKTFVTLLGDFLSYWAKGTFTEYEIFALQDFVKWLKEQKIEPKIAGKALSEAKIDIEPLSLSPADVQMIEKYQEQARKEIEAILFLGG